MVSLVTIGDESWAAPFAVELIRLCGRVPRKDSRCLALQAALDRAERIPGGYVVKDATGQALAYVYARETRADERSFILGSSVAAERHPICGKASMIAWLFWESPHFKLGPVPSGAFCFLMCLRGYSNSMAAVLTRRSCGVAAWTDSGGRDHGNSHSIRIRT